MESSKHNKLLKLPLSIFGLSGDTKKHLETLGVRTFGELVDLSQQKLQQLKILSETGLPEVRQLLARHGLRLREDVPRPGALLPLDERGTPDFWHPDVSGWTEEEKMTALNAWVTRTQLGDKTNEDHDEPEHRPGPINFIADLSKGLLHRKMSLRDAGKEQLRKVLTDGKIVPQEEVPAAIINLGEYLNTSILPCPPSDKQAFAEAVNNILSQHQYSIRILPEGSVARKMYVNSSGSLTFQCTDRSTPGLTFRTPKGDAKPRTFELLPYQRRSVKKPGFSPEP